MIDERLLDRNNPPEPELIRQLIGDEAFSLWEQVNQYLQKQYPDFQGGMTYYNAQRGWGQDYRKGAQRLCMLFPERGGLTFLTLSQDGEEAAQARDPLLQCSPAHFVKSALSFTPGTLAVDAP